MEEDLNNCSEQNPVFLDAAVIMAAADLFFINDDLEAFEVFVQSEKTKRHKIVNYFEEVIPLYSLSDFKSHFRLSRTTFATLLDTIAPLLLGNNQGPRVLSPEKQLAIGLWTFVNQEVYRSIADRFGVSKDTAWRCMLKVAKVLNEKAHDYIKWPHGQQLMQLEESFRQISGFPNVIAAVDGCHIPISAPTNDAAYYVNRKNFHSLILQGICDSERKFIDVFAGVCGSVHDARVFEMSDINSAIIEDRDRFCPQETHIVGDSAYGLSATMMTPFRDNGHLSRTQKNYNTAHSRTRVVIERAFALLKGRFRRLKYLYLQDVKYGPLIIIACCVLHNICLDLDDVMNDEILEEMDYDIAYDNEENIDHVAVPVIEKRNNIAEMLMRLRN